MYGSLNVTAIYATALQVPRKASHAIFLPSLELKVKDKQYYIIDVQYGGGY